MKIICHSNLDNYPSHKLPENLQYVPRIGETVNVKNECKDSYLSKNLPTRLEVVDVVYSEDYITIELWYKKIDVDIMKACNINMF